MPVTGSALPLHSQVPSGFVLTEIHVFGSGDSTLGPGRYAFEQVGPGAVQDSLVFVLDRGSNMLARLVVTADGNFRQPISVGGRGRRVVGRLLRPCCLAILTDGSIAVGETDGIVTLFTGQLYPAARAALPGVEGLAGLLHTGLLHSGDEDWLALVSQQTGYDLLLRIAGTRVDTLRPGISWLADSVPDAALHGRPHSPGVLYGDVGGTIIVGASGRPALARLAGDGVPMWSIDLRPPHVTDVLPEDAPGELRNASYRVSSVVVLPHGALLASLFRPGRPQTVVALVRLSGEVEDLFVAPFPLWFLGVARGKYLVAARIRAFSEIVTYALP